MPNCRDVGAVLSELHVHVATGDTDMRRAELAALVEACHAASGIVRAPGGRQIWRPRHGRSRCLAALDISSSLFSE